MRQRALATSATSAATRTPNAFVPNGPPRSRVRHCGLAIARTSASSMVAAARVKRSSLLRSPSQLSSIDAEPIREAGLARSCPAMSGAEPCWACASACASPALSEAASPRLPLISAARSERMSPNILVVTITSKAAAARTSSAAIASMIRSSYSTPGKRDATARTDSRKSPSDTRSTLALCTAVTFLRRCSASAKAVCAIRVEPARVTLRTESARSAVGMNSPEPRNIGVETLGVLARDNEVDRRSAARRKAAAASRRADIGKQVEPLAQFARRVETALRQRRIIVVRYRSEDHAVGGLGRVDRRLRQGGALRPQGRKPDRHRRERETELEEVIGRAKNRHGRSRDLRADAVALHHDNAQRHGRMTRCHALPPLLGREPSKSMAG